MSFHNRKLRKARQVFIFTIASIIALFAAYFIEYFLEIKPCMLCIYQRYLYWGVIFLAVLFYYINWQIFLLGIWLIYFSNVGLSAYHLGVELKFFNLPQVCQAQYEKIHNWEDLYKQTLEANLPACDNPTFIFKSISLTTVNFIYLIIVILLTFFTKNNAQRNKKSSY